MTFKNKMKPLHNEFDFLSVYFHTINWIILKILPSDLCAIIFRHNLMFSVMPPVKKSKRSAKTHSDCLSIVCAVCWRKKDNSRNVSDSVADNIRQFVYEGYDRDSGYHPCVICDGCRKTLTDLAKVICF